MPTTGKLLPSLERPTRRGSAGDPAFSTGVAFQQDSPHDATNAESLPVVRFGRSLQCARGVLDHVRPLNGSRDTEMHEQVRGTSHSNGGSSRSCKEGSSRAGTSLVAREITRFRRRRHPRRRAPPRRMKSAIGHVRCCRRTLWRRLLWSTLRWRSRVSGNGRLCPGEGYCGVLRCPSTRSFISATL